MNKAFLRLAAATLCVLAACGRLVSQGVQDGSVPARDGGLEATADASSVLPGPPNVPDGACAAPGQDDPPGPHGTLDPSFGDGGSASVAHDPSQINVQCLSGDSTGGVLLVTGATTEGMGFEVGRGYHLSASGMVLATWPSTPPNATLDGCAPSPDGTIFLVTRTYTDGGWSSSLAHVDANGNPDTTFGNVTLPSRPVALTVTPSAEPIVLGDSNTMIHYASDGSVVTQTPLSFGLAGTQFPSLARARTGAVYAAGFVSGAQPGIRIARLAGDAVDPSFGHAGWAFVPTTASSVEALAVTADDEDRAVIEVHVYSPPSAEVVRVTPQGQVDSCFGDGGTIEIAIESPVALAVQTNGKIVIASGYNPFMRVMRFDAFGAADVTFAGVNVPSSSSSQLVTNVVVLDGGSIFGATSWNLVRIVP